MGRDCGRRRCVEQPGTKACRQEGVLVRSAGSRLRRRPRRLLSLLGVSEPVSNRARINSAE